MTERLLKVLPLGVFGLLAFTLISKNTAPAQEPIPLFAPGQPLPPGPRVAPLPSLPIGGRAPAPGQPDPVPLPLPIPGQPAQPAQGDGIEVLAKGPVHEAFASTAEAPAASPIVAKQPPDPIEELPPDQKPAGDNVQWLPGYWHWDEESNQFIWVSGFWRQPPPGRAWIPGSWREAKGGWQYVPGFWQELAPRQPQPQQPLAQVQPEIEYLPQPPQSLEIGPSNAAPSVTSVYVPGSWVWRGKYIWRPGVWVEYRANWVWTPARYHWTPAGYVFCDGYWDYPLATRGVLFAPVVVSHTVYTRRGFVYTPVYVVSEPCMTGALFVRRGHGCYYFGDYFEPRYTTVGYTAWCGTVGRNGFVVGYGVGRSWGYDPLWSYYSVTYRENPRWHSGVNDLYAGRYRGDIARPPVTLVQQNTVINNVTKVNVTNVTNNITVVNGATTVNNKNVTNVAMVAPLKVAPDLTGTKFVPVSAASQHTEATAAKQIRDVGTQRTKLETAVANQPKPAVVPGAPHVAAQPQTIKLDVPKVAAARAAVSTEEHKAPPPNPLRTAPASPGAKIDPPKVNPPVTTPVQPPVTQPPTVTPKVNPPVTQPPVNPTTPPATTPVTPLPKVDPKLPVVPPVGAPKVDPKAPPKVDPKPAPKTDPKHAPKGEKPLAIAPPAPVVPQPVPAPVAVAKPQQPPVVPPAPIVAAPVVQPTAKPVAISPAVQPPQPAPAVPPKPVAITPPVVQPAPAVVAKPLMALTAPQQPAPVVVAKPQPAPVVAAPTPPPAPVVAAKPQSAPVAQPQPAPVVVAKPVPAPVAVAPPAPTAQPRPATAPPAAPPVKAVQPTKPQVPAEQPKTQPTAPGKPAKKSRDE